jgi:tetratricopeptide (TPR) repeat protein
MTTLLLLALVGPPPPAGLPGTAAALMAAGDAHYALRGDAVRDGVAAPAEVEQAIQDYRRAVEEAPGSYDARVRLLRALFFRGGFCDMAPGPQLQLFVEAKKLAEETVRRLEADLGPKRGEARLEALRRRPESAEVYLWAAISWGQWAVTHKLAAAWQGAAGRIRDLSETAIEVDPTVEQGGAYLILGRLHAEAPRIPLLTRWVSRRKGVESLERAVAIAPENRAARFFLASTLLDLDPSRAGEARRILEVLLVQAPRPDYRAEDAHYAEEARHRLSELAGAGSAGP